MFLGKPAPNAPEERQHAKYERLPAPDRADGRRRHPAHLVYERSGLLGVSGLSSDMRTLLTSGLPAAKKLSIFSSIGSGGSWVCSSPRRLGSTPSSLPEASGSTLPKYGRARVQARGMDRNPAR